MIPKIRQRRLRAISIQEAIEKSQRLLSQYWKNCNLIAPYLFRILVTLILFSSIVDTRRFYKFSMRMNILCSIKIKTYKSYFIIL